MQVVNAGAVKSSRNGSFVTVNNEGSGVIEIDKVPKSVVNFLTDVELERIFQDAGLENQSDGLVGVYDLNNSLNAQHLLRLVSYMQHKPLIHINVESPIILKAGESTVVPVFYWGDGELTAYSDDPNTIVTVNEKTLVINRLSGCKGEATIGITVSGTNNYSEETAYLRVAIGHRYGFRISKSDSDPYTRVSYMYDAVGMTPAHMDYKLGKFEYGSWKNKWFVADNKPLMLRSDGTVDYYLNPYDYNFKENGDLSDVSNLDYDGNAMAQFPLVWIKRWEDGNYEYEVVSDIQWDSDYKAYAHTRADGSIADYFYWSMFGGSGSASKIRSLAGQTRCTGLTAEQEIAGCQSNGAKWYTHTWSQHEFIRTLLILMGKNTNTEIVFGKGFAFKSNEITSANYLSMLFPTGTLKDKGQFYGYNTIHNQIKTFHVESLWGEGIIRMMGLCGVNGHVYSKMTPEGTGYSPTDISGYDDTGIIIPRSNGGFISKCKCGDYGIIPVEGNGSNGTYYCTSMWTYYTNSNVCLPFYGGIENDACFYFNLSVPGTTTYKYSLCGLSCEMPIA